MNSFRKLPFFLSGFMAVLVGAISVSSGTDNQAVYIRMAIAMVVFYIIGLYAGKTLDRLKTEITEKNAAIEQERKQLEENEARQEAAENQERLKGQNINLAAEDQDDVFEPLTVSRVIAGKVNE